MHSSNGSKSLDEIDNGMNTGNSANAGSTNLPIDANSNAIENTLASLHYQKLEAY